MIQNLKYNKLVIWISAFLLCFWVTFSYIQTEINTNVHLSKIENVATLCNSQKDESYKYAKLVQYDKNANYARIFCIFSDPDKNLQLDISYRNNTWEVYFVKRLNREGNFYWPIYI